MRILFLNQYFPPDPAPTGIQLRELGDHLQRRGHTTEFISAQQIYRGGSGSGKRAWRELRALVTVLWRGLKTERPDLVFSTTSPPLLLLAATLVAARHRAPSVHWVMDLYPELALALGELKAGAAARALKTLMRWGYHRAVAVIVLDQDMARRLEEDYGVLTEIRRPWVPTPLLSPQPGLEEPTPAWTWIYSGNLGRAHEWETLLETQRLLEEQGYPIHLLFQGGGPSWPRAQAKAAEMGLQRCAWRGYVDERELRASLLRCHLLVVTQRPETQGMLWPSKLAMLIHLPRPVLWIGPTEGAIADCLRDRGQAGTFAPGDAAGAAAWIAELHARPGRPAAAAPGASSEVERGEGLKHLSDLVERAYHRGV